MRWHYQHATLWGDGHWISAACVRDGDVEEGGRDRQGVCRQGRSPYGLDGRGKRKGKDVTRIECRRIDGQLRIAGAETRWPTAEVCDRRTRGRDHGTAISLLITHVRVIGKHNPGRIYRLIKDKYERLGRRRSCLRIEADGKRRAAR